MNGARAIRENVVEVSFLEKYMDSYLECYFRVSHPHILSLVKPMDDIRPLHDGGHSGDVPPPPMV